MSLAACSPSPELTGSRAPACVSACGGLGPAPARWLPGVRAYGFPDGECWSWNPDASAPCFWGTPGGLSWPGTLSGLHQLRTNALSSLWHEGRGRDVVIGKAVSTRMPWREGKGGQGLDYVLLRKGFCSERQAGQMCEFCASRRKTKGVDSLADCIKVCF